MAVSRRAEVAVHGRPAGILEEIEPGRAYRFEYLPDYDGHPVSLTLPIEDREHVFTVFPPFFDGLLPEGIQLEALLRLRKIDADDFFSQLLAVGADLVGTTTLSELEATGNGA